MLSITKKNIHYIKCTAGVIFGLGISYSVLDYMITDSKKFNNNIKNKNINIVLNK